MKKILILFCVVFPLQHIQCQTTVLAPNYKVIDINYYGDYTHSLILLHEVYNGTLIEKNYAVGTIKGMRGNAAAFDRMDVAQISSSSSYNNINGKVISFSSLGLKWTLKTVTYNGKRYMALEVPYSAAHHSCGYQFVGWTYSSSENMLCVTSDVVSDVQDFNPTMNEVHDVNNLVVNRKLEVGGTGAGSGIIMTTGDEAFVGWYDRTLKVTSPDNCWGWYASAGSTNLWDNLNQINRLTVTNTGNTGIGLTNPGEKLEVNGNTKATSFHSTSGQFNSCASNNIQLQTNGTTRVTIGTDGNTTFSGNINVNRINLNSTENKLVFGPGITEGYNRFVIQQGVSIPHIYIDYKENLHFRADKSWISALTLYGDGSVGIGFGTTYTTGDYRTHGYKLAVNGGIICEEVNVSVDVPDADYVFDTNYQLKTLPELDSFVKQHKHLPDIPSAEQFKKNGYKVGEMDEMLLRKIEELSLYIIELNKKIEVLEKRNDGNK